MARQRTTLSIPPSFVEIVQFARHYAQGRGIPFSAFVWQAVEHYLRELLGEEEISDTEMAELDRIEVEMDAGNYVSLSGLT